MLSQTDVERERYESRRMAQLDYNTGLKVARMDGEKVGMIRLVHTLEDLLNQAETPGDQLLLLSVEELVQIGKTLKAQLAKR